MKKASSLACTAILLLLGRSAWADWGLISPDPQNVVCSAMSFVGDKTGFILQHGGGFPAFELFATTDGATFAKVATDTTFKTLGAGAFVTMRFFDASNGVVVDGSITSSDVAATTDGGKTWAKVGSIPFVAQGVFFATSADGFAYGQKIGAYASAITHDGGKTWTPATIPAGAGAGSSLLAMIDAAGVLMVASAGAGGEAPYLSKDGGGTWTKGTVFPVGTLVAATFLDASNGYLYGNRGPGDGETFVTADGGSTWTSTTNHVAGAINLAGERMEWADTMHGTVFGHSLASSGPTAMIAHTTDGGKTWKLEVTPAAIDADGMGHAGPKFECSAYPGPSAYVGTMNHWLRNDAEGGAHPAAPDAGANATPDAGAPDAGTSTDGAVAPDAATSDVGPAADAATMPDSAQTTDAATPKPTADAGAPKSSGGGGCTLAGPQTFSSWTETIVFVFGLALWRLRRRLRS